jgi:hypothetical protein
LYAHVGLNYSKWIIMHRMENVKSRFLSASQCAMYYGKISTNISKKPATFIIILTWRRLQQVPSSCWYIPTKLGDVWSQTEICDNQYRWYEGYSTHSVSNVTQPHNLHILSHCLNRLVLTSVATVTLTYRLHMVQQFNSRNTINSLHNIAQCISTHISASCAIISGVFTQGHKTTKNDSAIL